jgi:hypothetical protein
MFSSILAMSWQKLNVNNSLDESQNKAAKLAG